MSTIRPNTYAEHDFEPVPGLPRPLPAGEELLWQGAPAWRSLAKRALLAKAVPVWFALIAGYRIAEGIAGMRSLGDVALSVGIQAGLCVAAVGLLCIYSYAIARTTLYTITDRRVVMRFGLAVDLAINLPFSRIEAADLRGFPDGTGDLALRILSGDRLAYLHLWPHARPGHFTHPQPMLRAVPDAARVAALLGDAFRAHAEAASPAPVATLHAAE